MQHHTRRRGNALLAKRHESFPSVDENELVFIPVKMDRIAAPGATSEMNIDIATPAAFVESTLMISPVSP